MKTVLAAAVLRPVAARINASEVDVSLSTVIALKVASSPDDNACCNNGAGMVASVKT